MKIKDKIEEIKAGYLEADIDTLEVWLGELVTTYAWLAEQIGSVKRDRALKELAIKIILVDKGLKPTEATIQREYLSSSEGQFLSYNESVIKGVSRLISAIRFKIEALRGIIH